MLDIFGSYHCMQPQEKLMNQTWENGRKKLVLGQILVSLAQIWAPNFFSWTWPLLHARNCCRLSLYPISWKTNELNLQRQQKTSFWAQFFLAHLHLAQIWATKVFQKYGSVSGQSLYVLVSYYHVHTISEKN